MKAPVTAAVLLFVAACGRTLANTLDARSALPPPDAFQCVLKAFEAEGFQRTSYDKDERRTEARRVNPKIQFSNIQFRKAYDVLAVNVVSGAGGETELKVQASTVAEYFSQRGPALEPQKASPDAVEAARTIAARCGG